MRRRKDSCPTSTRASACAFLWNVCLGSMSESGSLSRQSNGTNQTDVELTVRRNTVRYKKTKIFEKCISTFRRSPRQLVAKIPILECCSSLLSYHGGVVRGRRGSLCRGSGPTAIWIYNTVRSGVRRYGARVSAGIWCDGSFYQRVTLVRPETEVFPLGGFKPQTRIT